MYIDSHAHLTLSPAFDQIEELLQRAKETGITHIVNICVDRLSLERGLLLSQKYPWIVNTAAVTPHDVQEKNDDFFSFIQDSSKNNQLVAIGETGLDFHYYQASKEEQIASLQKHLELANDHHLPVVFHCREAFETLFSIADSYSITKAVIHCFTGTLEEAKKCLDRGWSLSFSGIVTFKKSEDLRKIAAYTPLESLFIETDTPYLAPQSKRGKMNEPSFIPEIVETLSQVKNLPHTRVALQTSLNIAKFFSFEKL